ncbi:MAG: hypothetical protein IKC63_07590 [Clostridia bacterium]|nr:hypothetical protein [Clostridia bacterium]
MKKIFVILTLTAILLISSAIPAFAADISTNNGNAQVTVNGTYVTGTTAAEVISVDVAWGSMSFTYQDTDEGKWNDKTHKYDDVVDAYWTCAADANKITVTNHSNTPVEATLTFTKAEGTNIEGAFTETVGTANDGVMALATAVGTTYENAPSVTAYFNVTAGKITANGTLGTVTLTIVNQ